MKGEKEQFKKRVFLSLMLTVVLMIVFGTVPIINTFAQAQEKTASPAADKMTPEQAEVLKFGLVAAAIAFGFGAIGAGVAIGNVGAAAMGAIGEKPEIASQALIFIALAEGLVVFGFITALMILGKV
ncbi:MAG TPA: ATP synthase subunit C [Spirochaetia bacterium]|nr:ATP synthase subunit C [Spirochaetia bacterium]